MELVELWRGRVQWKSGCVFRGPLHEGDLWIHHDPLKMEVFLDSSAARGGFQRQGVGRIRHLEVKSLWAPEEAVFSALGLIKKSAAILAATFLLPARCQLTEV